VPRGGFAVLWMRQLDDRDRFTAGPIEIGGLK